MKEVIIAVLWLVIGIINYKVFEEDDILALAICLLFAPLFFPITLIIIALKILYDLFG